MCSWIVTKFKELIIDMIHGQNKFVTGNEREAIRKRMICGRLVTTIVGKGQTLVFVDLGSVVFSRIALHSPMVPVCFFAIATRSTLVCGKAIFFALGFPLGVSLCVLEPVFQKRSNFAFCCGFAEFARAVTADVIEALTAAFATTTIRPEVVEAAFSVIEAAFSVTASDQRALAMASAVGVLAWGYAE